MLQMIQFGDAYFCSLLSPNRARFADPVNLQFVGLTAQQVGQILVGDSHRPWNPTSISGSMDAYFDCRGVGGVESWKAPDETLELIYPKQGQNPWGLRTPRLHIRIYDGPCADPHRGPWTIANVHLEHVGPATHLVHAWNEPGDFVADRVSTLTGGSTTSVSSPSGGLYHGAAFDGVVRSVAVAWTPPKPSAGSWKL